MTLFCTKPSEQIIWFHVADVKMLGFFIVYCITTLLVFDDPKFQGFLLNTFQRRNAGAKSVGTKVDL